MSMPQFTPGPWRMLSVPYATGERFQIVHGRRRPIAATMAGDRSHSKIMADAHLIAAAPELYDGCNAMLGLIQLVLGRDDLTDDLRLALTTNHRIAEAEAATAKARGEL